VSIFCKSCQKIDFWYYNLPNLGNFVKKVRNLEWFVHITSEYIARKSNHYDTKCA